MLRHKQVKVRQQKAYRIWLGETLRIQSGFRIRHLAATASTALYLVARDSTEPTPLLRRLVQPVTIAGASNVVR